MRLLGLLNLMGAVFSGTMFGLEIHQAWREGALLHNPGGKLLFAM